MNKPIFYQATFFIKLITGIVFLYASLFSASELNAQITLQNYPANGAAFTTQEKTYIQDRLQGITGNPAYLSGSVISVNDVADVGLTSSLVNGGRPFTIVTPDSTVLFASRMRTMSDEFVTTHFGTITGYSTSLNDTVNGNYAFTYCDGKVSGFLQYDTTSYKISPIKTGYSFLDKVSHASSQECAAPLAGSGPGVGTCTVQTYDTANIRMLMLFDENAFPRPQYDPPYHTGWFQLLYLAFEAWPIAATFNMAASNSGLGHITMTPVYDWISDFSYSGGDDPRIRINNDLQTLIYDPAIENKRKENHCDVVGLFTPAQYSIFAGVANIDDSLTLSTRLICVLDYALGPQYTFAHEFGHLFSARHDWLNDNTDICNHGHFFHLQSPVKRRTVMAYPVIPSVPVLHYSNPEVLWYGAPTGSATTDNAKAVNHLSKTMKDYAPCNTFPSFLHWNFYVEDWMVDVPYCKPHAEVEATFCEYGPWDLTANWMTDHIVSYKWYLDNNLVHTSTEPKFTLDLSSYAVNDIVFFDLTAAYVYEFGLSEFTESLNFRIIDAPCAPPGGEPHVAGDHTGLLATRVSVFPNPASGELNISIPGLPGPAEIIITDILGRHRYRDTLMAEKTAKINISSLPPGVYNTIVKISDAFISKKIIVIH